MFFLVARRHFIFSFLWLFFLDLSVHTKSTGSEKFDLRHYHSFSEPLKDSVTVIHFIQPLFRQIKEFIHCTPFTFERDSECKKCKQIHGGDDHALQANISFFTIQNFLHHLSKNHPSKVLLIDLRFKTYQNRTLTVCKIGQRGRKKPSIWIDAGLHSREWISTATALYFIDKIIKNDTLTQLVNFYILPVSNPDGYEYSRTINRDWRKNRSNCSSDSDHCCGTDLNRNFDFDWGVTDSPHDPCSELNSGPSAASEPETRSIKKFLTKLVNRFSLKAYLTLHSYGQFWFYPYGHKKSLTNDQLPVNFLELKQLADDASTAIYKMSRNTVLYKTGRAANLIYPSSGGSDDWAKGHLGVEYVFCLELPPTDSEPEEFLLPESRIESTAENLWPGLTKVFDKIIEKYASKMEERRSIDGASNIFNSKSQLYM